MKARRAFRNRKSRHTRRRLLIEPLEQRMLLSAAPAAQDDGYSVDDDALLSVLADAGLLANDTDADTGDVLTVSDVDSSDTIGTVTWNGDGSFAYDPDGQFGWLPQGVTATDSFSYTVSDGNGGTDTATVTITITGVSGLSVRWQTDLNEPESAQNELLATKLTPDGGELLVAHFTLSPAARVQKLDAYSGDIVWNKTATLDGKAALSGWVDTEGYLYLGSCWGGYELCKYDSELDTELWSYTGPRGLEYVYNIITDASGNVYAAGFFGSGSNGGSLAVKLNSDGQVVWEHLSRHTSSKDNYAYGLALDSSGNLYRVGHDYHYGTLLSRGRIIGHGATDGSEILNKPVDETNSRMGAIITDASDNLYVAYSYNIVSEDWVPSGQAQTVLQKLDQQGNVLWEYRFDVEGMYLNRDALIKHGEGSFYLVYQLDIDGTLYPGIAELNYDGELLWMDTIDRPGWTALSGGDAGNGTIYVGLTDQADLTQSQVLALARNEARVAADDAYSVDEDATLVVAAAGVLSNDTDADGDALSAVLASGPSHGTLTLESDGSFSYIPDANYHGTDSFTYNANDGTEDCDVATVTITVNPANDAPEAQDDEYGSQLAIELDYVINTNGSVGGIALSPDDSRLFVAFWEDSPSSRVQEYDLSNGQLLQTIEYGSYHTHGDVVVSAEGDRIFTTNYYPDTVSQVDLANGNERTDRSTIDTWPGHISITPDRTRVLASVGMDGRSYDMNNDSIAIYDISDGAFSLLSSVPLDDEPRGELAFSADSQYAYVVTHAWKSDSARLYEISLSGTYDLARYLEFNGLTELCAVATNGDKIFVASLEESTIWVVDATSWTIVSEIDLTHNAETLAMHPDGQHLYASLRNTQTVIAIDVGSEQVVAQYDELQDLWYRDIEFTSDGSKMFVSHYPNAGNVMVFDIARSSVHEDGTLFVSASAGVLSNDIDVDGDALSAVLVGGPSHGTLMLESDGSFSYTPDADYHGTDSFVYKASDGELDSNVATVTISVNPVNDCPVIDASDLVLSAETIHEGGSVRLAGSFSDSEGKAHAVTFDWGDGTLDTIELAEGVTSFETTDHIYADDPAGTQDDYTITVTVADQSGFSDSAETSVAVNNVDPRLNVGHDWIVVAGKSFTIQDVGTFSDPGFGTETFIVTIDWGDGTTETFAPRFTDGGPDTATTGSFDSQHAYDQTGEYTVAVTVTDDDGGAAAEQFTIAAWADLAGFITPRGGWLYVKALGGSAGARTEFGFGSSIDTHDAILTDLPRHTEEVLVRHVHANEQLHFSLKSRWQGRTAYAFSSENDAASTESFTDRDNSLGWSGAIVEQVGRNTWVLHCDDPVDNDDDDNDVVIQIRIGSAPPSLEPPRSPLPPPAPRRDNIVDLLKLQMEVASPRQAPNIPIPQRPASSATNSQNGMSVGSTGYGNVGESQTDGHSATGQAETNFDFGKKGSARSEPSILAHPWEDLIHELRKEVLGSGLDFLGVGVKVLGSEGVGVKGVGVRS